MTLKDELPRSVGAQYATGKEWRNNSRKNEDLSMSISKANHSISYQVYAPTSNAEEAEVEWFYEVLGVKEAVIGRKP